MGRFGILGDSKSFRFPQRDLHIHQRCSSAWIHRLKSLYFFASCQKTMIVWALIADTHIREQLNRKSYHYKHESHSSLNILSIPFELCSISSRIRTFRVYALFYNQNKS